MPDSYDCIVIGSGPGGYVAAIRAAQLGLKTACVEKDTHGGRCLNYACIPAKTLLHAAEVYAEARDGAAELGVEIGSVSLNWAKVQERRESVRATLTGGVAGLFTRNGITYLNGEASLTAEGEVEIKGETPTTLGASNGIILATGSVAMSIPGVEFGGRILDTWGAWSLDELPARLAVVGAGASGSEIASAYARFGTEVILIEMLDQILPAEEPEMAKVVERTFKKQGIEVATGVRVENISASADSVSFNYGEQTATVDYLVIAGGRAPDVAALGLDLAGVEVGEDRKLVVDQRQMTTRAGIYAIGDLVGGPALAHKASEEGVLAVEAIAGLPTRPIDYGGIPGATFTHPQVASVGMTEAQATAAGHAIKLGKFKLGGVGAATVYGDGAGMIKLVVDAAYGEILGAHIVGNRACDMISELVNIRELEGGYQELARIIHPHPTISEAVLDAARSVDGWATHQ